MITVIAKPGTKCPREGKPREYISDVKAEGVPDTAYYRRLITDGSLTEVAAETAPPVIPAKAGIQDSKNKKQGGNE